MKDEIETATKYNYGELLDRTDWKTKLAINIGLALPGLAVIFLANSLLIQFIGGVWAGINLLPVFQWVIGV